MPRSGKLLADYDRSDLGFKMSTYVIELLALVHWSKPLGCLLRDKASGYLVSFELFSNDVFYDESKGVSPSQLVCQFFVVESCELLIELYKSNSDEHNELVSDTALHIEQTSAHEFYRYAWPTHNIDCSFSHLP